MDRKKEIEFDNDLKSQSKNNGKSTSAGASTSSNTGLTENEKIIKPFLDALQAQKQKTRNTRLAVCIKNDENQRNKEAICDAFTAQTTPAFLERNPGFLAKLKTLKQTLAALRLNNANQLHFCPNTLGLKLLTLLEERLPAPVVATAAATAASTPPAAATDPTDGTMVIATQAAINANGNHSTVAAEAFDATAAGASAPLVTPAASPSKPPTATTAWVNRKIEAMAQVRNGHMTPADFDAVGDDLFPDVDERRLSEIMTTLNLQLPRKEGAEADAAAAGSAEADIPERSAATAAGIATAATADDAGSAPTDANPDPAEPPSATASPAAAAPAPTTAAGAAGSSAHDDTPPLVTALDFSSPKKKKTDTPQPATEKEKEESDLVDSFLEGPAQQPTDSSGNPIAVDPVVPVLKEHIRLLHSRLKRHNEAIAKIKEFNTTLTDENNSLRVTIADNLAHQKVQEQALADKDSALRQALQEKDAAETAFIAANDSLTTLQATLRDITARNNNLETSVNAQAENITELQAEIASLKARNSLASAKQKMNVSSNSQANLSLEEERAVRIRLQKENAALQEEITLATKQLEDANRLLASLQAQLKLTESSRVAGDTTHSPSVSDLIKDAAKDTRIQELTNELLLLKAQKTDVLSATIERLRHEQLDHFAAKRASDEAMNVRMQQLIADNTSLIEQQKRSDAEHKRHLEELEARIKELTTTSVAVTEQRSKLFESLADAKSRIEAIEGVGLGEKAVDSPPAHHRRILGPEDVIAVINQMSANPGSSARIINARKAAALQLAGQTSAAPLLLSAAATAAAAAATDDSPVPIATSSSYGPT